VSAAKYETIRDNLRDWIGRTRQPGESIPGQADLAKRYQVSLMTAHRAVSELVEDGVLVRSHGRRTVVASPHEPRRRKGSAGARILLLNGGGVAVFEKLAVRLQKDLAALGHACALSDFDYFSPNRPGAAAADVERALRNTRPDAIVCGQVSHMWDEISALMAGVKCPVVYTQCYRAVPASFVTVNMGEAAYLAGCRRIRYYGPKDKPGDWSWHRFSGVRRYLAEFEPDMALEDFCVETGYTADPACKTALAEFTAGRVPDGVLASNDFVAMGVMMAARERGIRIPDDLAVVGMDDISAAAASSPPLTTIAQPVDEVAREVTRILQDMLSGGASRQQVVISPRLVIRGSTVNADALAPVAGAR